MPELPVADQRLANVDIKTLKEKSKIVQTVVSPNEKFRFHRYRALLDKRELKDPGPEEEEEAGDANIVGNEEEQDDEIPEDSAYVLFNGMTLADKKQCNLTVQSDGTIKYMDSVASDDVKFKGNTARSFLVQKLDNCQITFEGTYESMHIIDTKNTTLRIARPIQGPVHVTNCHDTQIQIAFARQLRIHNCTNVSFECHVASGPIIEECTKMKFYQQDYLYEEGSENIDNQNLYWDVKDFQWLKTLVKSPNFEIFSHGFNKRQDILTVEQEGAVMQQDESSDDDEL